MHRYTLAAAVGVAAVLVGGCGGVPQHTQVTGVVTLDGQPFPDAIITFIPEGGGGMTPVGHSDEAGRFRMGTESSDNGVVPGKYKVTVTPSTAKESKPSGHPSDAFQNKGMEGKKFDGTAEYRKIENEATKAAKEARKNAATKYGDPAKTPLWVEVGKTAQEVKLEMKKDAK
jgi:hypothetical protein